MTADSYSLPLLPTSDPGLLLDLLESRLQVGRLRITLPSGSSRLLEGKHPGPQAEMVVRHLRAFRRFVTGGAIGLAESYMDGDWDSPDLAALLELGDNNNRASGTAARGRRLLRSLNRLWHRLRDNNRRGSRRNIAAHYDLGNDFYRLWLDPGMTYSAALYGDGELNLEAAQQAKYHALARDVGLRPGMTVLEIGCGWGGFAEIAARDYGASVVGLTLSREQHAWASDRLARVGLAGQTDIRLQDYRDVSGQFDAIVSIEMIEAVGERWWPVYFQTLRDRLKPGGKAGLQAITIADERFPDYRRHCDFIQRHVFPGGMLPSPAALAEHATGAGLSIRQTRHFGMDYERTLAEWQSAFDASWPHIAAQGFDERFRRLWCFYLAYCRAGFRTGSIDVRHMVLS